MTSLAFPTNLHAYLNRLEKKPSKSLSQNFLIDFNIVQKFIEAADLSSDDFVLEIGPGPGVFTEEILKKGAQVLAIEKDKGFAEGLREQHHSSHLLQVLEGDFLEIDFLPLLPKGKKIKVLSNLPFQLTSPILGKLLPLENQIEFCLFIMQKEVAERIVAKPKSKAFSPLSIFAQSYATPSLCFHISSSCFFPKPKVTCSALLLTLHPPICEKPEHFLSFIRTPFQQRRKKLTSTLPFPSAKILETLKKLELSENARPEELDLNSWVDLYREFH
jgi:16S rRNA (adenine1518-N6/adenine1519-N6)-dimethyltransferase